MLECHPKSSLDASVAADRQAYIITASLPTTKYSYDLLATYQTIKQYTSEQKDAVDV